MRRLIAVLVLIGVAAASAADDYLTEILDAPTPAARQPLLQAHREKLSYGTVMGLARAAEAAATSERGARAMEVADEIAALLAEDRAIAYAAMLRGHFHLTREELPPAAKAFEKAATHWQQADWPAAAASAQAWRAVCAARLGQTEQAKVWLERSLSDAPRLGPVVRPAADQEAVLHAWAATRRAGFEEDSQRWVAAETWYLEAVRRWEPTGLELPLAYALDRAGLVSYYQSKLDQAAALYRRSLAAAEQATDAHQIGRAHLGFAEIANDRADHETVLRELEAAVEPFRQAGSNVDLARVYWLRAVVRQNRGEHHLVEAELQQAEAAYRAADSPGGLADCGFVRGSNWLYLGDRARALDAWAEAARIYDEVNNRLGAANVKLKQSHAYRLVGMYDEARRLSEEALGSYRLLRDRPGEANCLRALGLVAKATGDLQAAEERYEQAAAIYQAIGDQLGQAYVDYLRGTIMRERGEAAEPAIKLLLDSMNRYEAIGDRHGAALPAIELGVICAVHGDGELAYRAFMKALSLGEQTGSRSIMASALYRLGQLAEARQPPDLAAAAELYQMAVDVVEQMRARAGSQEAQQGLQQGYLDYYDALVRVLVRQRQPALALAAAEAARARTLLDLVA
ncbi:MAG: tetratricopeptide repeat protein, partial [Armatimonadetes bacterium]|nr:tetratricopeptide repeat protein [Armatimonadota bacterium]